MTTIKDVAREADVAISTVSKVLNDAGNVRPHLKARVLEAVDKLGYIPNTAARSLKSRRKDTLGLFLFSIQGEFFTTLSQAIHRLCQQSGYMLNIFVGNQNTSEEIHSRILASGVAGAIVFNETLAPQSIQRITAHGIPLVFIDREYKALNASSITIDNVAGASLAVNYLIRQGHRKIAYLHGNLSFDNAQRFSAYQDIMKKNRLPIPEEWLLRGFYEEVLAYGEVRKAVLSGLPLPEAFFCANDEMAWGTIRALRDLGIAVPGQVSVVGFDDVTRAEHYSPALTTVHSPIAEVGTQSVKELLRLLSDGTPKEGRIQRLAPSLITRESCTLRLDARV
ncbi:MAG: LacI family transcriptional regulator [Clostridiales bacterium]|nr:LacI family transcriptional regulator [Clostridiales bacterium]